MDLSKIHKEFLKLNSQMNRLQSRQRSEQRAPQRRWGGCAGHQEVMDENRRTCHPHPRTWPRPSALITLSAGRVRATGDSHGCGAEDGAIFRRHSADSCEDKPSPLKRPSHNTPRHLPKTYTWVLDNLRQWSARRNPSSRWASKQTVVRAFSENQQ